MTDTTQSANQETQHVPRDDIDLIACERLVRKFRSRANAMRGQAFGILSVIILALCAAVWVFFEAANITKQDVKTGEVFNTTRKIYDRIEEISNTIEPKPEVSDFLNPEFIEERRRAIQQKIIDLFSEIEFFSKIYNSQEGVVADYKKENYLFSQALNYWNTIEIKNHEFDGNYSSHFPNFPDEISIPAPIARFLFEDAIDELSIKLQMIFPNIIDHYNQISRTYSETNIDTQNQITKYKAAKNEWSARNEHLHLEIAELQKAIPEVLHNQKTKKYGVSDKAEPNKISWSFLIQTNITRFGPMIIILFFVGILVNLYRYNFRLSAYYDARADSLELMMLYSNAAHLETLVPLLSPDTLDIGKPPKLPTEYVVDIAKTAIGKVAPTG